MWTPEQVSRRERDVKAMIRSAGDDDPEAFAELVRLADLLHGDGLRAAYATLTGRGYSAAEIARPLGITKQAAWHRFRRR